MKTVVWCLLFLAARVGGQTIPDELTGRLASDLSPLKSLPRVNGDRLRGLPDLTASDLTALRSYVAQQSPEQYRIMSRFVYDMAERYGKPLVPWQVAYALTSVLAGRELPDEKLKPLAESLLMAFDSAVSCQESQTSLKKSAKFRLALESVSSSLNGFGVDPADALIVIETLSNAGLRIANPQGPVVKPIPPYKPRNPRDQN